MTTAKDLCEHFEGCRLIAYKPTPTDPWTIGWGHTGPFVHSGLVCTQEEADQWLENDLAQAAAVVDNAVKVQLTQNQRQALIDFVYNVGPGKIGGKDGFVHLSNGEPSTMLKLINSMLFSDAAEQFGKWVRGGGIILPGLQKRREAERLLFLTE